MLVNRSGAAGSYTRGGGLSDQAGPALDQVNNFVVQPLDLAVQVGWVPCALTTNVRCHYDVPVLFDDPLL